MGVGWKRGSTGRRCSGALTGLRASLILSHSVTAASLDLSPEWIFFLKFLLN